MMKIKHLLFLSVLIFILPRAYAQVNLSDLIEVTDKTKEKCVEYYNRGGTLYCSTKAIEKSPLPPDILSYEKQNIVFDDRTWKLAWGKKTDNITTVEYVPIEENITGWNELITSQFISQLPPNVTPRMIAERMINNITKTGLYPNAVYHSVTPDEVIFEFRITKPENQIQDEIQIIRKKPDGFYILHYVIKEKDMGKEKRDKWIGNLSKSTVKK